MKKFVRDVDAKFMRVTGDNHPFEVTSKGHLMSGISNPNRTSSFVISTGWPVKGIWPSVNNVSRFHIDEDILAEDLAVGTGSILLNSLPLHPIDSVTDCKYVLNFGNFSAEWDVLFPKVKLNLNGHELEESKTDLVKSEITDLYKLLNYGNYTIDLAAILNHYSVLNYAIERGRGQSLSGYFYVDNPGDWSFSVDGTNVLELMVNGSLVYSRYATGSASGTQDKYGTVNLSSGWNKFWAYCSASMPTVWYKRPGDGSWSSLNNNMDWCTPTAVYMPLSLSFTKIADTLRSVISYNSTNTLTLDAPFSEFYGGVINIKTDTTPKAQAYYSKNWTNSSVEGSYTNPPFFRNMRVLTKFDPISETITQNGINVGEFTPFAFSLNKTDWWVYDKTNGFSNVSISSVSDLKSYGNTLLEVTEIPEEDWVIFLGTNKYCWMSFTGQAPLFLTCIKASLNLANNEYALVDLEKIANRVRLDKNEL